MRPPRTAPTRAGLPWLWLAPPVLRRLAAGFVALVFAAWVIAVLHGAVSPEWDTAGVDAGVAHGLAERRHDGLLAALQAASLLGKIWVVAPLVAVIGVAVWRRTGRWIAFWLPAFAGAGGFAISVTVKYLVSRPRPPMDIAAVEAFGPSYPSGHVIRATAVYAALAWLAGVLARRRAAAVSAWVGAVLVAGVVGFARLYEAAHWPVDVLVSYGVGAGWLTVVLAASGWLPRHEQPPADRPPPA